MSENLIEPLNAVYQALKKADKELQEERVKWMKYEELEALYKESMTFGVMKDKQLRIAENEKISLKFRCKELEQKLKLKSEQCDALLKSNKELTDIINRSSRPGIKPTTNSNIIVKKEPVAMPNIPQSLPSSSKPLKLSPTTSRPTDELSNPTPTKPPTPPATLSSRPKIASLSPTVYKPPIKQPLKPLKPSLKRSASPSHVKQNATKSKIPKLGTTSVSQRGTTRIPSFVCPDCYNDWYNAKSDLVRSQKRLVVRNFSSHQKLIEHIFENHPSTATRETVCPEPGCTDQKGHTNEPHGDAYKCAAPDADGQTCGRTYQNRTDYRFHVNVEHANTSQLNPRQLYSLWHTDFS